MPLVEWNEALQTADGPIGIAVKHQDTGGPLPTVVLLHHGPGLDGATHDAMSMLAGRGFFVACSDRYHRLGLFTSFAIHRPDGSFDPDVMPLSRAALLGTDDGMVERDLTELVRYLDKQPLADAGRLGLVGYCVGVRSMLFAMASRPERFVAGVGFHPSFCVDAAASDGAPLEGLLGAPGPLSRLTQIDGQVLLFFGTEDRISSVEANAPLMEATRALPGGRGHVEFVDGGDHGFGLPGRAWATGGSDRAYTRTVGFIGDALRG